MGDGKQKESPGYADVVRNIFGEGETIKGERVYTVGAGKGEVPISFLFKYTAERYKVGDKIPESIVREAVAQYVASKNPKDVEKSLKKDIMEMKKADTLGAGTLRAEVGGQVGIPVKVEDREKEGIEKGARFTVERKEKYGKTWGGELSYTSAGAYGGTVSYSDLFVSGATDKWKVGMGGPLEFGLMSGDIEDVVFMKGLERPWNLKVDWKKTGAWVRPYFGLNYGPWYFLYNPITRGFYGGFNIWGGIIGYAQNAFSKGMNECEGCGTGKKVLAGLGELIGLSSGIREWGQAWKRSKGNFFQRFFYSLSNFFKGMFASIGYVGLQVGLVQPWRLFVNSLYRFVFRAKTPKDAKTREFTPEEIVKMREKLERELAGGMVDKAKDDVEMWLKYEKLPPAFRGYLMGIRDRIDIMGAYVGLPFTFFPPGWKKSKAKRDIELRTRNAIAEIEQGKNVLQNTVYLEQKLAGVEKETLAKKVFEEISPCVIPKDDIAKAVGLGFDKLTSQFNTWADEIEKGKDAHAFEFTSSSDIVNGFLPLMPREYSYLMTKTPINQIEGKTMAKAGYYSAKQLVGKTVDTETELESVVGAYATAYYSYALSDKEVENESEYLHKLINQDKKMAIHLLSRTWGNIEMAANEWRKAVEERNMDKAREYEGYLVYCGKVADIVIKGLPKDLGDKEFEKNKEKISYLAIVGMVGSPATLLKYHPEFKKALGMIETADVKQMKTSLKKSIDDMMTAIDAGNYEEAKKIWDKIDDYVRKGNEEKAKQIDGLLAKSRWSDDDKREMKAILRHFKVNI
ncbi:MAG: hypothetical protein ACPL06_03930 [Candidatus Anstonellales archaeon]